ncbi:hypothetical protein [Rhizobium acaciae]|uniref:hypothetical protein n=1 Tax=Rhizobium acaciae TaxID=2989736 RepID=UPI00221F3A4C|nr:hypothetical protein [Rhizobium acaciae]MCW1750591.1 hypothetical protein [Rhizobium acaciae]
MIENILHVHDHHCFIATSSLNLLAGLFNICTKVLCGVAGVPPMACRLQTSSANLAIRLSP